MRVKRSLTLAPNHEENGGLYHIVSRVVWRQFIFDEEEKVFFYSLLRKFEVFTGVQIQAFCLMSNHFHLLLRVPPKPHDVLEDDAFFERLSAVYSDDDLFVVKSLIEDARKKQSRCGEGSSRFLQYEQNIEKLKQPYLDRMWNLSVFMKEVKQGFTRWYNKKYNKSGTLWEGRFKSQLVQEGYAAKMVAAYIDLNPIRAGLVADPKDYRWCSYGEAVAGGKRAQAGLLAVMNKHQGDGEAIEDSSLTWKDVMGDYRVILAEEGVAVDQDAPGEIGERKDQRMKKKKGFSREEADRIIERGGKLSCVQMLRCKTRYFIDGMVIGNQGYVNAFFEKLKLETGAYQRRNSGARKLRNLNEEDGDKFFVMRDLRG